MTPLHRSFLASALALSAMAAAGCVEPVTSPVMSHRPQATIVPVVSSVGQIAAGGYHTCALKTDGSVVCWGRNFAHQSTPPAGLVGVQLSSGANHSCVVKADGTVACWGDDLEGQSSVPPGLLAVQVGAGANHTCAVTQDATVVCWGVTNPADDKGQTTVPAGLTSVTEVAGGADHTCALKTDGTVVCWGTDFNGQLQIPGGLIATQLSGSRRLHTCALQPSGAPACWGYGPLAATPPGIVASQISAGGTHTCAVRLDATVTCWGFYGQPLPEAQADFGQTIVPAGLASVVQVSSGGFHTCALKSDGTVVCWGLNDTNETDVPPGLNLITTQPQAITFTSSPPASLIYGGSYAVTATGGASGNPVTFSTLTSGTCTVAGGIVSFIATGTCTVAADQGGSTGYFSAPQVTQSMTIAKAPQVLAFTSTPPDPAILGGAYAVSANSSIGAVVSFTSSGTCSAVGTSVQLSAVGSCVVTAHAAGNDNYLDANGPAQTFSIVFGFVSSGSPTFAQTLGNSANSGQTVQITFGLDGNQGLAILVAGSPSSVQISCSLLDTVGEYVAAVQPGSSELSYNASQDEYHYLWKTQKDWAGTCRQFVLTLIDGTVHRANFAFVK